MMNHYFIQTVKGIVSLLLAVICIGLVLSFSSTITAWLQSVRLFLLIVRVTLYTTITALFWRLRNNATFPRRKIALWLALLIILVEYSNYLPLSGGTER